MYVIQIFILDYITISLLLLYFRLHNADYVNSFMYI